jgi:hypothetical protein
MHKDVSGSDWIFILMMLLVNFPINERIMQSPVDVEEKRLVHHRAHNELDEHFGKRRNVIKID